MLTEFDFWQFIGGLGLFLFAMAQLEQALRSFAGQPFRRFLRDHTNNPLESAAVGGITTALLQSSSLVGLMVLAFVGAGMMTLKNALGVIFGANLGTTLTGWLVATIGFKLDLASFAVPLIGVGCLALVSLSGKLSESGRLTLALGLLLLGLVWMKDSTTALQQGFDIHYLAGLPLFAYLLFGLVFAAVVQSSSATMMITLAALNSQLIELDSAAAIAIGADLGTTSTLLLGAAQGAIVKKQVAAAHLLFNLISDILAFLFLHPLLKLVALLGIEDPLFSLVGFHSLFNGIGLCLFLPFTGPLAGWLEKKIHGSDERLGKYVWQMDPDVAEAALVAIENETARLLAWVIRQNLIVFSPPLPRPAGKLPVPLPPDELDGLVLQNFDIAYRNSKQLEGEILAFAVQVQTQPLKEQESNRLTQLLSAVRFGVQSSKSFRDIRQDLDDFENSPRAAVNEYLEHFRSVASAFYAQIYTLPDLTNSNNAFEELAQLLSQAHGGHDQLQRAIYLDLKRGRLGERDVSALLNVNREILSADLNLVMALGCFHLSREQAEALGQLPSAE